MTKNDFSINETLNELLLKVLSGVDYVSRIALETQKSIPVVYRQLDVLVDFGILSKGREGKKVTYSVNWINLSDMVSSTLLLDFEKLKKLTNLDLHERNLQIEIGGLLDAIPKEILETKKGLKIVVYDFFNTPSVIEMLHGFVDDLEKTGKDFSEYNKIAFNKSVDMFLDMFGMLNEKEQKKLFSKEDYEKNKDFLNYCRLRYLQKQTVDPRREFIVRMLEKN